MPKQQKQREVIGAVTEHWVDKRLREGKSINLVDHFPRISAETLLKMNDLRNELLGTKYSVREWIDQLSHNEVSYDDFGNVVRQG
jgi:hypothetical protein